MKEIEHAINYDYNQLEIKYVESYEKDIQAQIERILFERQEFNAIHNTPAWGNEFIDYIIRGDKEGLHERMAQGLKITGLPGQYSNSPVRNMKVLCITMTCLILNTLMSKNLLDSEIGYSICDACIQFIEKADSVDSVLSIMYAACLVYMSRIHNNVDVQYHPLVQSAKRYVYEHLHNKICISEMAKHLGTSQSYLCRIFHQKEGITLGEYVMRERMNRASNLLKYSNYSIQEISDYLHFSSCSHFGKVFKKRFSISPLKFRQYYANNKAD